MRAISPKRAKRLLEVSDFRRSLVERVGRCEWCWADCGGLCVHEISQGSSRQASLDEAACVLVLGTACHDLLHRMPEKRQAGLALLKLSRPEDYSLSRFWKVTGRNWPSQREIDLWIDRFSRG
jgi:hypothetical protein